MAAAIFEAALSAEQAAELARLMEEGRPTRPAGVLTAALLYDGDARPAHCDLEGTLATLEQYVAEHRGAARTRTDARRSASSQR